MGEMPDNSSGQPPLQGLRVVEFATVIAGPGAAMYLADQGADVVKVESLVGTRCAVWLWPVRLRQRGLPLPSRP